MATEDHARARLSQLMEDRRLDLRMTTWDEVAAKVGVSVAHLRRVRSGTAPLTPKVMRGIEDALRWGRGSVEKILYGGLPIETPADDATSSTPVEVATDTKTERPRLEALEGDGRSIEGDIDEEERRFLRDLEHGIVWETPPHGLLDNSEVIMWALPMPPLARWRAIRGKRSAQEDSAKERSRRQPEADRPWEVNGR